MSEFDDITIDSWGKAEKKDEKGRGSEPAPDHGSPRQTQKEPASDGQADQESPSVDSASKRSNASDGRQTRKRAPPSPPIKILDEDAIEGKFEPLLRQHTALGNWMFRHKKFDRASASWFIKFYRELKKEGFE